MIMKVLITESISHYILLFMVLLLHALGSCNLCFEILAGCAGFLVATLYTNQHCLACLLGNMLIQLSMNDG